MWNRRNRIRCKRGKGLYAVIAGIAVLFIFVIAILVCAITEWMHGGEEAPFDENVTPPDIQERFLTPNEYSRPGTALSEVHGIVIHYTANPGTDAMANRNYFDNLSVTNRKQKNKTYASSHFVIGTEGEIVQCIPLNEIAYASNDRNADTVSIECCHKKKNGKFTKRTYSSLLELTTYLCKRYRLSEKNVIRHYDVTEKNCPKYFVEHEDAWHRFLSDVAAELKK